MNNKDYLDKVVDHMVRNTVIENYLWNPTLRLIDSPIPIFAPDVAEDSWGYMLPLYNYLTKQFGLTNDEVQYVFGRWVGVMKEMYREDGNVDL
jgi:hypothetical protein